MQAAKQITSDRLTDHGRWKLVAGKQLPIGKLDHTRPVEKLPGERQNRGELAAA